MSDIGMSEASDKASTPSTVMVFWGLEVNTVDMTIRIPDDKLVEILSLLKQWYWMKGATKKQTQSLVGLLNFAAGCIKPGRTYFSRILNFLHSFGNRKYCLIPQEVKQDVRWWLQCATNFTGTSLIMNPWWETVGQSVHTDACLGGIGGWTDDQYFHFRLPSTI